MQEILFNAIPYAVIVAAVWPLKLLLDKINIPHSKNKVWLNLLIDFATAFAPFLILLFLAVLAMLVKVSTEILLSGTLMNNGGELRWYILSFVGLLTALGGIIGTPLAMIRVFNSERQTTTQETGLTTDRINKAVEGLGTEKTIKTTQGDKTLEHSAPNIEVRIGAIYALERIAQEDLSFHIQIMEILCAYVRHNAPASPAPDDLEKLTLPRDDIQVAITTIGRRNGDQIALERAVKTPDGRGYRLDLRRTCLQQVDLNNLNFSVAQLEDAKLQGADLMEAKLQRAYLIGAKLQRADLDWAELQGAYLDWAELQGAHLWEAKLQGADLRGAKLQGAYLRGTIIDADTSLDPTSLKGAGLRRVDFSNIENPKLLADAFGDASVTLPDGYTAGQGDLAHWSSEESDFHSQWRAHQKTIGYDPDDP